MVTKVADAVQVAMERAGITDAADVHYVQTKTPLLTIHTIRDAKSRGQDGVDRAHARVDGPLQRRAPRSASRSRSARSRCRPTSDVHARPVAVLVGRVVLRRRRARPGPGGRGRQRARRRRPLPDRALGDDATRSTPDGIWDAIRDAGLELPERPHTDRPRAAGWSTCSSSARSARTARCAAAATRCSTTPTCTGTGRSRPAVGGVTAAVTGDPAVFVSVSAAHQGPDGGGPVAAIVDLGPEPTGYVPPTS